MTDYLNLSFETGDPAPRKNVVGDSLLADNWSSSGVSTAVQYVDFGELGDVAEPAERFETEWTGINEFTFEFLPGFVDLEPYIFNTGSDVDITETFDFWDPNFVFELARVERLKFNGNTLDNETFEVGWGNDDAIFGFANTDLQGADFTEDALAIESFEEDWKIDGYKEEFEASDLEVLDFTWSTFTEPYEGFDPVNEYFKFCRVLDAQIGEVYEVTINQRTLDIESTTAVENTLRDQIVDMINNSPEPVTAVGSGVDGFLIADNETPVTSIVGVKGPPTGSGPSIEIQDVFDLGYWSQVGLIENFVLP